METVYPASSSALARGRRVRRGDLRARRTTPVTFAEIKEVDEDNEEAGDGAGAPGASTCEERRRRRPDLLDEPLGRQFLEFRQRRARRTRRDELREREDSPPAPRAASEPRPLGPRAYPADDKSPSVERQHDIT